MYTGKIFGSFKTFNLKWIPSRLNIASKIATFIYMINGNILGIYMHIKEVALRKCAHENNTSEIFLAYKIFIEE